MGQTNAQGIRRGFGLIHIGRQVRQHMAALQHGRQQPAILCRINQNRTRLPVYLHIRGQTAPDQTRPDPFRLIRIMITGDQMPLEIRKLPHPLNGLMQRPFGRGFMLIHIPRNQHMGHPFLPGKMAKPPDHFQPFRLQRAKRIIIGKADYAANLPV